MTVCERCWHLAKMREVSYEDQLALAEREHQPCTADTPEGKRLRRGEVEPTPSDD